MQPKKKAPRRRCLGCSETKNKSELIRIVRTPEGKVELDKIGKKSGRGAYICKDVQCLAKAHRAGRLGKNLKCEIPEELYRLLEMELIKNGKDE